MNKSKLNPFLKANLDILFVGLNPAKGSSENRHYFSVNQSFWNQLTDAGIIIKKINKDKADMTVFGSNEINYMGCSFGITDIVTDIAESKSNKVKIHSIHNQELTDVIRTYKPKVVILIHQKATSSFLKYHHLPKQNANCGYLGKIIPESESLFYSIGFPHGNSIPSAEKIKKYIEVKEKLSEIKMKY